MKKIFFLFYSILIFALIVGLSYFVGDIESPEIKVIEKPRLACSCKYEDLIEYAKASDENLKSFFVQDDGIAHVIESGYITYVAIDNSNNITKLKVPVEIDAEYTKYHLVNKNELQVQLGSKFNINDYFELQNECGITINDRLKISSFDLNKIGLYDVKVESMINHSNPLYVSIEVVDKNAPKITLTKDEIHWYTNRRWKDYDFLSIIDSLEDDIDSYDYLYERLEINWAEVMHPDNNGLVTGVGTYTVTYTITDSDNNVTKKKINVYLEPEPVLTEEIIGG